MNLYTARGKHGLRVDERKANHFSTTDRLVVSIHSLLGLEEAKMRRTAVGALRTSASAARDFGNKNETKDNEEKKIKKNNKKKNQPAAGRAGHFVNK